MSPTLSNKYNVAIAGASDVSKYLIEELITASINNPDSPPKITVLTRSLSGRPWFTSNPYVSLETSDYTTDSIRSILNRAGATVLFSFIHTNDPGFYVNAHKAMLDACRSSERCRRFVPSDYGGDVERFPGLPRFYDPTHRVFREEVLERERESSGAGGGDGDGDGEKVEWTVINMGWFMDYFVQGNAVDPNGITTYPYTKPTTTRKLDTSIPRSYLKPCPGFWPLNIEKFTATILGTGNEPIGWTSARDVARALVALLSVPHGHWERHTYVVGQIGTWNEAIRIVEEFFNREFKVTRQKSVEGIQKDVQKAVAAEDADAGAGSTDMDPFQRSQAYMDEWNVVGATAVSMDLVQEQRERFFSGVKFRGIRELLRDAFEGSGIV